jgi:hypothetical protein
MHIDHTDYSLPTLDVITTNKASLLMPGIVQSVYKVLFSFERFLKW